MQSPMLQGTDRDEAGRFHKFGNLIIEPQMLTTPALSIVIPNISHLRTSEFHTPETLKPNPERKRVLTTVGLATLGLAVAALLLFAALPYRHQFMSPVAAALVQLFAGAAYLVWAASRLPEKIVDTHESSSYTLYVVTNQGGGMYFSSADKTVVDNVRRLIHDRINNYDVKSTYHINFEQGVIQNMGVSKVDSIGTLVSGDNNKVVNGSGRIDSHDIKQSQGVQIGENLTANGNTYRVDYAGVLPVVEQWSKHFAASEHAEISRRLAELERLMREGTPSPQAKGRLRELTQQLTNMLDGAADAAKLFGSIARLAGF
jgi:hypothetical protein